MILNKIKKYPRIAYIHVPKCGGVSVSDAIFSATYPGWMKATSFKSEIDLEASRVTAEVMSEEMQKIRQITLCEFLARKKSRYFSGHTSITTEILDQFATDWNFVTMLRNPVDRFVSEYTYNTHKRSSWAKNDASIEEYLNLPAAEEAATTITRFFTGCNLASLKKLEINECVNLAIVNLQKFAVVGFLHDIDAFQASLGNHLSISTKLAHKNSSPASKVSNELFDDDSLISQVKKLSQMDMLVYEKAVSLFNKNYS